MKITISLDLPESTYRDDTSRDTFSEWLTSQILDAIYDQIQFDVIEDFTITIGDEMWDANTLLTHHNGIIVDNPSQIERVNRFLNGNAVGPRIGETL